MAQIKCTCGNIYEDTFKFCPECATPNPAYGQNNSAPPQARKKFTRISPAGNKEQAPPDKIVAKKIPIVADRADTYEDNDEQESVQASAPVTITPKKITPVIIEPPRPEPATQEYEDDYEDDYEDNIDSHNVNHNNNTEEYDEDDEDINEYDDEYEEENDEEYEEPVRHKKPRSLFSSVPKPSLMSAKKKGRKPAGLSAPRNMVNRGYEDDYEEEDEDEYEDTRRRPRAPKRNNHPSFARSNENTVSKKRNTYDPNFDGYYDDRLPAILDEVTRTSHLDVILKIALAVICLAAVITYCIFYVNV